MLTMMAVDWLIDNRPDLWRCFATWDDDCDQAGAKQTYRQAAEWYRQAISLDPGR
jgi:TPR repeat protein